MCGVSSAPNTTQVYLLIAPHPAIVVGPTTPCVGFAENLGSSGHTPTSPLLPRQPARPSMLEKRECCAEGGKGGWMIRNLRLGLNSLRAEGQFCCPVLGGVVCRRALCQPWIEKCRMNEEV